MYKLRILCLIPAILLYGCSTLKSVVPKKAMPEKPTVYMEVSSIPELKTEDIQIQPQQVYPEAKVCSDGGSQYACFDRPGFFVLLTNKDVCKGYESELKSVKVMYASTVDERNNILQLAKAEEKKANYLSQLVAQKDAELKNTKREYFIKTWVERVVFAIIVYLR